jgi:predicted Zn-dependent protease
VGFIAGVVISPEIAQFADVGQQALGLIFLKFSRDHESESDELGVEYSTKIDYDAHKMADFFQTLNRLSGGDEGESIPTFLSTHPNPADRYNRVHKLATDAQKNLDKSTLEVNRNSYLQMINGLVYGEDPRQGYVENSVFYHPELKFQFPVPTGWATQNSPQDVRMAPKDGKALMIFGFAPGNTLDEVSQAFVQENQLQVVESKRETVNGFPALALLADQVNAQDPQQVLRILTYFIQDGQTIYKFHGLSMSTDYIGYAALFKNTMTGYRRLTDQSKINRLPERIKVVSAPRTGTVRDAFSSLQVPATRMDEFAVLNSMDLNDQVEAGTMLKVLQ